MAGITTLDTDCGSGDATIDVVDQSVLRDNELLLIDDELMIATAFGMDAVSVTRAVDQTEAAAHSSGANVYPVVHVNFGGTGINVYYKDSSGAVLLHNIQTIGPGIGNVKVVNEPTEAGESLISLSEVEAEWAAGGASMPQLTVVRTGGTEPLIAAVEGASVDGVTSSTLVAASFDIPTDAETLAFANLGLFTTPVGDGVVGPNWSAPALTDLSLPALARFLGVNGGTFSPTMAALTSLDLSALTEIGTFDPVMASLLSLDLSALPTITDLSVTLASLTSLDLSALASVGNDFSPTLASLTSLDLSALASVGNDFSPTLASLPSLDLSALASVGNDFSPTLASLTSLDLSALASVGGVLGGDLSSLTDLSLPVLVSLGNDFVIQAPSLTSLDVPELVTCGTGGIFCDVSALTSMSFPSLTTIETFAPTIVALTSLSLPALLAVTNVAFIATGAALDQASVDGILVKLASLDGTGGTTAFSNGTIDLSGGTSAAPSVPGGGVAAVATLTAPGRDNSVTTN